MEELNNFREFLNAEVVTLDELNEEMDPWTVADAIELKKMIARTLDYETRAERAKIRLAKTFEKFENKVQGRGLKAAYEEFGTSHIADVVNMMFPDKRQGEEVNEDQTELFDLPTNLTGEDAWIVAKQISGGQLDYKKGKLMVADVVQLDKDLRYIEDIVNSHTFEGKNKD